MNTWGYTEPRPGVIAFHGEVTIDTARQLFDCLFEKLALFPKLEVDLLNVSKFDTAGVQVLLVLHEECRQLGKTLQWLGFSLAVSEVLEVLDLQDVIGRPGAVVWS